MAFRMVAKALGVHGFTAIAASALVATNAVAEVSPGAAPPANAGVSVSLGGSSNAQASAPPASPAADQGGTSAPTRTDGDENPANYEFAFVSVGAYQTWSIAGRVLFVGAGGGLGPPLYRYSKIGSNGAGWNPTLDIVYGNFFLRVSPVRYLDIDVGPKISLGATLFDVPDPPQSAFTFGGYADLRVGSRTIKVGPRFEYVKVAHSDFSESGWILTPLMLRVVH
jgi:hypothetical protein